MLSLSRPPRPSRPLLLVSVLLATGAGMLLGQAPAEAVDTGTLGIRPAHESTFFHLSAYPGETVRNTAIVSNHTSKPVTLLDYPVDAHNSATGTFAMASQTDPRATVGAWVHLASSSITIPAGADRPLPFRLTVPAGTAPGDYAGALIIQAPPVIGKTATHSGTAVRLNIIQRQGLRIYLHVDGAATRALTVGSMHWTNTGGGTDFTLPIHNTGNTTLHPAASLVIASRIGANAHLSFTRVESILPGDQLTLHAHLEHPAAIQIGAATATVRSEAGSKTTTTDYTNLPWAPIAATLAVLLLAALAATSRARSRRRRAHTHRAARRFPRSVPAAPRLTGGRHRTAEAR